MAVFIPNRNEWRHNQVSTDHKSQQNSNYPGLERSFQVGSSFPQPEGAETQEKSSHLTRIRRNAEYEGIDFFLRRKCDNEYCRDVVDNQPTERSVERSG